MFLCISSTHLSFIRPSLVSICFALLDAMCGVSVIQDQVDMSHVISYVTSFMSLQDDHKMNFQSGS